MLIREAHMRKARRRSSGIAPFRWEFDETRRLCRINEAEQATAWWMQALRDAARTLREIAGELNEAGVATKTGSGWWSPSVVRAALMRPPLVPRPDAGETAGGAA